MTLLLMQNLAEFFHVEFRPNHAITDESPYGKTIRAQVFRMIVASALHMDNDYWKTEFAVAIQLNELPLEELETEIKLRKEMWLQLESKIGPLVDIKTANTGGITIGGVRKQVLEVIVRQALIGAPWQEICAGPMAANNITVEEVEAVVVERKKLQGKLDTTNVNL